MGIFLWIHKKSFYDSQLVLEWAEKKEWHSPRSVSWGGLHSVDCYSVTKKNVEPMLTRFPQYLVIINVWMSESEAGS